MFDGLKESREVKRKHLAAIGIVLAVLGALALIWQRVGYTQRETLVDVGSVNITTDTRKSIELPPILGGLALACGVGLIVVGSKKS